MSRKIINRAIADVPFGWTFRNGSPAKPSVTVSIEKATKLKLTGTVDAKAGTVTTKAKDARPRMLVLLNAVQLTAAAPEGAMPAGGVAVSDATLRAIITQHGWLTVLNAFPTSGAKPSAKDRAAIDANESSAFFSYLRSAESIEDIDDTGSAEAAL